MEENITKPEPTKFLRWTVLVFVSLAMFGNYYIYDCISPLADLLTHQLKFTDENIGLLQAIYSIPNIFMVLIGGFIIDRIGTKKASFIFSLFCMLGAVVTALRGDLITMAIGRLIFGLGAESLIVAATTIIARWFKGKELSFAFGINLTIARLGSFAALNSPSWGHSFFSYWQSPLWVAAWAGVISVISIIIYVIIDSAAERKYAVKKEGEQDKVVFKDIFNFGKSFWFITFLCVTFYSAMFPFQTFAVKFFMLKHFTQVPVGVARSMGGFLSSLLTLSAMILTPLFGLLSDKIGKRSGLMFIGSFLIIPVYLMMNYIHVDSKIPVEALNSINGRQEILKDYVDGQNEALATIDLSKVENGNKLQDIKSKVLYKVDSLKLTNSYAVSIQDMKIKIDEKETSDSVNFFVYFLNMIKILVLYFPNILIPMVIMGVAFSLVPAVLWPSVAIVVDGPKLGTAYGLMTMIQNIGLSGFNLLIGYANDATGGYTAGMWIFSSLGLFGLIFAYFLRVNEKGPNAHGLELGMNNKKETE
jgi:MFS family permease